MGASSKLRRQSVAIDFAAAGISFATVHETSPRLHADRVAGGHCHHRHSGRPAVAGAGKAKGQEIYCLNNIKQLTLAAKMYSGDNGDRFAWTFTLVGSQQNRTSWFNYLLPYQETKKHFAAPASLSRPRRRFTTLAEPRTTTPPTSGSAAATGPVSGNTPHSRRAQCAAPPLSFTRPTAAAGLSTPPTQENVSRHSRRRKPAAGSSTTPATARPAAAASPPAIRTGAGRTCATAAAATSASPMATPRGCHRSSGTGPARRGSTPIAVDSKPEGASLRLSVGWPGANLAA